MFPFGRGGKRENEARAFGFNFFGLGSRMREAQSKHGLGGRDRPLSTNEYGTGRGKKEKQTKNVGHG